MAHNVFKYKYEGLKIDNSWRESPRRIDVFHGNPRQNDLFLNEFFLHNAATACLRGEKGRKVEFLVPNLVHSSEPNWNLVPS